MLKDVKFDNILGKNFFYEKKEHILSKTMNPHYHILYEIYRLESGKCNYFVENQTFEVCSGDIIIIPENCIHNVLYNNKFYSRQLVNCSKSFIPSSVIHSIPKFGYLYRNNDISDKITEIFKNIENEYVNQDEYSMDSIKLQMYSLFLLMARNKNYCHTLNIKTSNFIKEAIKYIQQNYNSGISLTEIADYSSVSEVHFSRSFKKETGIGFNEYLSIIRLRNAENLLKKSSSSISEIAFSCGFNDSNYFSLKFKKEYGVSPTEYRKTPDRL